MTICQMTICRTTQKQRFNVVFTTCNGQQYRRDGRAKVYERSKHRATPGQEAGVFWHFVIFLCDLMNRQIELANRTLANCYPPI